MTYAEGEPIYGAGTQIRYAVLAAGTTARPLQAAFKTVTGVTTSEIKGTTAKKDIPGDYGTSPSNAWEDSRPGQRAWSFTLAVNKKNDDAQAAMLEELRDAWAAGSYIWIERLTPEDTHWRGGLSYLSDVGEPSPWDGVTTLSSTVTGKGALTKLAVA